MTNLTIEDAQEAVRSLLPTDLIVVAYRELSILKGLTKLYNALEYEAEVGDIITKIRALCERFDKDNYNSWNSTTKPTDFDINLLYRLKSVDEKLQSEIDNWAVVMKHRDEHYKKGKE